MGENAGIESGSQGAPVVSGGLTNGGTGQQTQPGQQNVGQQQGGKPYDQYLQKLPEALRPTVEPIFAEWDSGTTKRFQDYSEQIKSYEPYQQIIDGYEPEALDFAVNIASQLETQEGAEQLFQQLATALGYTVEGNGQPNGQNGQNGQDENYGYDPEQQQQDPFSNPRFQTVEKAVTNLAQQFEQQTQNQQMERQQQEVQKEWDAAVEKNKTLLTGPDGQLNKKAEEFVMTLAAYQTGGDIDKAFEEYSQIVGKQAAAQNAPGQNAPIVGGGSQSNMPSNIQDVSTLTPQQRKEAALAILRANNAQT